ncbi:MAG: hemagglutinin repeat-containing protein, partial [Neisseriaceae bacterium]|nr:hemagglutinin repeat-containing protein [Neisseriaceae bacterium]
NRKYTGSIIFANDINLSNLDTLTNSGTIQTRQTMNLDGKQIDNSGRLKGNIVQANADKININGGKVIADSAIVMNGKEIGITSTTNTNQNGTTIINKVGKLEITGNNNNGIIYLNAENKLTTKAANIQNNSIGGRTLIKGGEIDLGTITTSHKEKFGEATDKNHRIVESTTENGTNINGIGDIQIIASKGKLNGSAVNINSENGTTILYGKDGVNIKEGRKTIYLDEAYKTKSKGLLSSKTTNYQIQRNDDLAVNSNITGNKVLIQSAKDIDLTGTNAVSDSGTVVYSENGDVKINAAKNFYNIEEERKVKKSGLLGTGGIGFTIGQQKTKTENDNAALIHSGSMVGSLNGDTTIYAGKNYSQVGSTVSSANGKTTISGSQVDIKAAKNRNEDKYKQTFEQKGLTVSLSSPITDLAQKTVQSAQKVGKSKNARVNAMAAFNTGYGAYTVAKDASKMMGVGQAAQGGKNPQGAGSAVKVSITYGQQKNTQESNSVATNAAASQVLGEKVNITARESDINIIGSDVSGRLLTDLVAAKDVNILAAANTQSEKAKNESVGAHVGVAFDVQGGGSLGFNIGGNYGKGKANGNNITYQNSHVGSLTGQTNITAGKTLNIKGGQVLGKGVKIDATDINIHSMQDTMTYNSKQQQGSVDVTIGYGFSGSASYNQSKINADYASVNEQSGIFAGDDGYQINVKNHTDLKGGIITSTQNAENNGKNRFETGTLSFEDIANHSEYLGSGFGIGVSGTVAGNSGNPNSHIMNVADKNTLSHNGIGYASDSDSQSSVTHSGINTANITITNADKQKELTGKTVDETIQAIKTDISTDNYADHSGTLKNVFDAQSVQDEIDLGVEVMQDFSRNVQDFRNKQNKRKDELKAKLDTNEISQQDYDAQVKRIDRQNLVLNTVAGGLMAPSDSVLGIATSTVAPYASYRVGQYFKEQGKEGSFEHLATHAVIGALTAQANGGNALAGAVSAGGGEYIAKVTAETLFNKKAEDLTADEKQTVSTIAQLVGTVSGSVLGDSSANAYIGGTVATNAVENNYLGYYGKNNKTDFAKDLSRDCGKNGSPERCTATYNKYKEISYKQGFAYQGEDSKWEEYVAATYENKILPLCNGNAACETAVIQDMQINLVLYAGAPGEFKHAIEHSEIATNIKSGNWGTLGLQAFGDLTLLTGVRGLVNPNSAYSRLMNSAITPSKANPVYPSTQIGAVGGDQSAFMKGMVTSQKLVRDDLLKKGVHVNVGKVELRVLPDNNGGIVFKPAFSQKYTTKEVNEAISQANKALENESFRKFLLKHSEAGFTLAKQEGNPKAIEFKFVSDAVKRMNNNKK